MYHFFRPYLENLIAFGFRYLIFLAFQVEFRKILDSDVVSHITIFEWSETASERTVPKSEKPGPAHYGILGPLLR